MSENTKPKHQDVSDGQSLLKRGSYSLLRILITIHAAGPDGIPTRRLLDQIGTHATYTQKLIEKAIEDDKLIERTNGQPSGPGQFPPVYNIIIQKGKQLLQRGHHPLPY